MAPGQQKIGHAAQGVDVIAPIWRLALEHFTTGILRCKRQQRFAVETGGIAGRQRVVQRACDTKIQHFDLVILSDKDVPGLEVRVHHRVIVHVGERFTTATDDVPGPVPGQTLPMLAQELVQRFSAHVFHDHENNVVMAVKVIDANNIRMVELAGVVDFAAQ